MISDPTRDPTRDSSRDAEAVRDVLAKASTEPDQLLPVLHAVQAKLGFISRDAIRLVAQAFNLSRADVYGVVTFYGDFREEPIGDHRVQLCMAEACQSVGCRALAAHAEQVLDVKMGESTTDGLVHLEAAYCFGNCALGPTVRIDDRIVGRVTPERLDALLARLRDRSMVQ